MIHFGSADLLRCRRTLHSVLCLDTLDALLLVIDLPLNLRLVKTVNDRVFSLCYVY